MTTLPDTLRAGSLSRKIIVMVLAILAISCVLFCAISVVSSRAEIRDSIEQRMLDIANCASASVDGDVLETLTADDVGSPSFQSVYDALAVFRDNVELEYVYAVHDEGDGTFTFTVDPDPVDPGAFGEPTLTTEGLVRAATGVASVDDAAYTDSWGTSISAYSPVFDSAGKVAGIVGVDFTVDWFQGQLAERTRATIMASLAVLAVTLVVAGALSYVVVRPFAQHQQRLTLEVEERAEEYVRLYQQLLTTLADAVDARNPYAAGHSRRVSAYATLVGSAMGLDEEQVSALGLAALMHDIGCVGVPDTILNSPNELTALERAAVRSHTEAGAKMLRDVIGREEAAEVANYHHERWDGTGYPAGLAGEAIPAWARIVGACDAFDAMSSPRAFRSELSDDEIRAELTRGRGTQFDPAVVDVLVSLWDAGELDAVRAEVNAQAPRVAEGPTALLQEVVSAFVSQSAADEVDVTTGVLARASGETLIANALKERPGVLVFLDMDNLKQVNDTQGHDAGDRSLRLVGDALRSLGDDALACRLGGDEFLVFMPEVSTDEAAWKLREVIAAFNEGKRADEALEAASLSAGLVACVPPTSFPDARAKADKALYRVKQSGKNDIAFFDVVADANETNVETIVDGIHTTGTYAGALDVEYHQFAHLYEYLSNLERRYAHPFRLILVTLDEREGAGPTTPAELESDMAALELSIRKTIRNVDVLTRYGTHQFLVILLGADSDGARHAIHRIFRDYERSGERPHVPTYHIADVDDALAPASLAGDGTPPLQAPQDAGTDAAALGATDRADTADASGEGQVSDETHLPAKDVSCEPLPTAHVSEQESRSEVAPSHPEA